MVDFKFVREHIEEYKQAIAEKKIDLDLDELLKLDDKRKQLEQETDDINRQRNEAQRDRDIERGKALKEKFLEVDIKLCDVVVEMVRLEVKVPTIPSADTPKGKSEADNVEVSHWGEKPAFDFEPKDHVELGKALDILDLERGSKVAGYRGYFLKNEGAILQMAIMMYALQKITNAGYKPMIPPTLVKEFPLLGSGYFKGMNYNPDVDEIYKIANDDEQGQQKFLIGTAEPSLLAYYAGEVLDESQLPMRLGGFSQCYRSEIGSYGKDTKGIFRVHEFMKVEQVVLCAADEKEAEKLQEEMVALSEEMHQELGLPFRKIIICTGDLSAGKYRQFDLEAWMPGMDRYGETGSASIFLDWQSRRLDVKYKTEDGKKFVYMLNNTALPSARIWIAIIENNQQADGSIIIPEVLQAYCGFKEIKALT